MDLKTKTLLTAIGTKGLTTVATVLVTHGVIMADTTETFVAIGLYGGSVVLTVWEQYLKAIVISKLEVLKATALAQAEALRSANVPPPTATQIANKGPDSVTPEVVRKVTAAIVTDATIQPAQKGPAL